MRRAGGVALLFVAAALAVTGCTGGGLDTVQSAVSSAASNLPSVTASPRPSTPEAPATSRTPALPTAPTAPTASTATPATTATATSTTTATATATATVTSSATQTLTVTETPTPTPTPSLTTPTPTPSQTSAVASSPGAASSGASDAWLWLVVLAVVALGAGVAAVLVARSRRRAAWGAEAHDVAAAGYAVVDQVGAGVVTAPAAETTDQARLNDSALDALQARVTSLRLQAYDDAGRTRATAVADAVESVRASLTAVRVSSQPDRPAATAALGARLEGLRQALGELAGSSTHRA